MSWSSHAALFVMAYVAAYGGTGLATMVLHWKAMFDHPNERSSHRSPTPRGAGLAVTPILAAAWIGIVRFAPDADSHGEWVGWCALALGAVSWIDDRRGLPVWLRLVAHVVVVGVALFAMRDVGPFFGNLLSPNLDLFAAWLLWIWFLNLYNFMDGIDGITGAETTAIGLGVAAVAALAGLGGSLTAFGLALTGAAFGFLWWNWHPARVFLGDVGSVPVGFLTGWLLLTLAAQGQWAAASILPLYYLADATVTLARRIARGEKFWQPHRQHFYQQAARGKYGHAGTVLAVTIANAGLVGLALLAAFGRPVEAVAASVLVVAALLFMFARAGRWA